MSDKANEKNPNGSPGDPDPIDDDQVHAALDSRLLMRLWGYLLPYKGAALGCLFVSLAVAGLRLSQPILIHRILSVELAALLEITDRPIEMSDLTGFASMCLLFLGLIFLMLIMDIVFTYATGVIGQKSMHDLRSAIFRHVSRLDVAYFDRTPVGRLLTRMTSDISALNDLFSTGVIALLAETLMLFGLVGVMLFYNVRLTLIVLCAVPLMLIVVALFRRHSRRWYLEVRARLARMNAYLQENIAGMRTVQSFNREGRNMERFSEFNDTYRDAQLNTITAFAFFFPALNLVLYSTLAAVIWFGGGQVVQGAVSFATLFLFVQCINMLFAPMRSLSEKYNVLQAAMASSARIFRLLDTPANIVRPDEPEPVRRLERGISFEHVSFEYVKGEPVLHDVSFEIEQGKTIAIVGATGSGKTTLTNLLMRFYDVSEGRILVDGVDIRRFDPEKLRRMFALVLQEVMLFSDTIAGNIRMTNPDLTDEQVWDLLRRVHAEDFVRGLPDGINSPVRERGATFSTGQKQLLAFARALAADPQFLILDEATANVDTTTEQRIQGAIEELLEGRTGLVVAHRLSTIRKADLILVMHKGRVHESGTHDELLEHDGLYRNLYELQFRPEKLELQVS